MTECARCGECCERIYLQTWSPEQVARIAAGDEVRWGCNAIADATFIVEHWTSTVQESGAVRYSCDAFDPATRLCTAHDHRPPICRGFPWYGGEVVPGRIGGYKSCSFWADVPRVEWPDGVIPLPDPRAIPGDAP